MLLRSTLLVAGLAFPSLVWAQDATTPGQLTAPYPTLENISVEWDIDGDDNNNGVASVRYRKQGGAWHHAMPLIRVPGDSNEGFSWRNRHAGSIFGLVPGQTYDVEVHLVDPDGGDVTESLVVATRPEPVAPSGATVVSVTPGTIGSALGSAGPNTIIELAAGSYGEISMPTDGEPGLPIILRGVSSDTVTINGDLRMDNRSHVWVQDLHVVGKVKFNNSNSVVVQRLLVETDADGIVAYGQGTVNTYIADNEVIGSSTEWSEDALGVNGNNLGEGIVLTGPGNVIAYNRVSNFRDCLSLLEGPGAAIDQFSIDIIGNDLDICADDAIEADFSLGNVRVIRNRMSNSFIALSSQPSLGGPTYFIRNVVFNTIFQAFKPNRGSIGDLWFHNTVIKPGDAMGVYAGRTWSRATFRNNLLIGGAGGGTYNGFSNGSGRPIHVADADDSCDFDYDGFGVVAVSGFSGRIGNTSFDSFAELTSLTTEANATLVGLDVFAADVVFPETPFPAKTTPDLRLAAGSAAVDQGQLLPNLNDGFAGAGPDLGAYEAGIEPPHYGPREDPVCGNSVLEAGEACDDGNLASGDGCDLQCQSESPGDRPDAGSTSGGSDAGTDTSSSSNGGCGCQNSSSSGLSGGFFLLVLLFLRRQRLYC